MKRLIMLSALALATIVWSGHTLEAQVAAPAPAPGTTSAPVAVPAPAPAAVVDLQAPPSPFEQNVFHLEAGGPKYDMFFKGPRGAGGPVDPETMNLINEDGELSRQIQELAMKYKGQTGEQRASTEREIAGMVSKQFVLRQSLREKELAQLEEQVRRLRDLHAERTSQRDRIVADRVQQLLREAEGLGWGDVSEAGGDRILWKMRTPTTATTPMKRRILTGPGGATTILGTTETDAFDAGSTSSSAGGTQR